MAPRVGEGYDGRTWFTYFTLMTCSSRSGRSSHSLYKLENKQMTCSSIISYLGPRKLFLNDVFV